MRGIILDSPPYKITPEQFVSGFAGAVNLPAFLQPVNKALWRSFFAVYLHGERLDRFKEMESELIYHPVRLLQWCSLSSTNDSLSLASNSAACTV